MAQANDSFEWTIQKDWWLFVNWQNYVVSDIAKKFKISREDVKERIRLYGFRNSQNDKEGGLTITEFVYKCLTFHGYNEENLEALTFIMFPSNADKIKKIRIRQCYTKSRRKAILSQNK